VVRDGARPPDVGHPALGHRLARLLGLRAGPDPRRHGRATLIVRDDRHCGVGGRAAKVGMGARLAVERECSRRASVATQSQALLSALQPALSTTNHATRRHLARALDEHGGSADRRVHRR